MENYRKKKEAILQKVISEKTIKLTSKINIEAMICAFCFHLKLINIKKQNTMKKLLTILFLWGVGLSTVVLAQNKITGTVVDADDIPIIGASVIIEGATSIGVITNLEGEFTLDSAPASGFLQVSYIGYTTKRITINNQKNFRIVLEEEAKMLEELVVVGYGMTKKSDLTGAVAQIKAEDIVLSSAGNPMEAMQGRISGVSVLTNNKPGSSPTMRIRGSGSIDANNEPLYVIDGFPLMTSDISDLNSNDIESIEILKDASSAAIYGSRGANGVVLITTKNGGKGRNNLSVSTYLGIQTAARLVKTLERNDFINYINDAFMAQGGVPMYTENSPAPNYNTDWQRELINNNAIVQDYSVTFDGGTDKTSYLLSLGYYDQDGLIPSTGYEKFSGRMRLNHEFKPWMKVGANMQYTNTRQNIYDNATGDIFRFGWPTTPVKNEDGSWYTYKQDPQHATHMEGEFNPVWKTATETNWVKKNRFLGDVFIELQLLKGLTLRSNVGVDVVNGRSYNYISNASPEAVLNPGRGGQGSQGFDKAISKLNENILTYTNMWDKHRLTATAVYSYQDYVYESTAVRGAGFFTDATGAWNMDLANRESIAYPTAKDGNKLVSFTGRVSYSFHDKYLLTATGRYDGSSRFGKNNKWGFFPSVGIGWRVNEEKFLQGNNTITNLKLRASYGQTGNQEIGNYKSLPLLSMNNYVHNDGLLIGLNERLSNPDLKWERTHQYDVGVDLQLFNRINITFDGYQRVTKDLLYDVPIPSTSGFSSVLQNIGEVKNTGFEFEVNARVIDTEFKWDVGANFSYNKNEITKLYGGVESINVGESASGLWQQLKVGYPVNGIWARQSGGIIRTDEQLAEYQKIIPGAQLGDEMYVNQNDDKSINTADYVYLGAVEPKYTYGLSMNFEYKKFSLNLHGQGAFSYASVAGGDQGKFNSSGDSGSPLAIGYSDLNNYLLYGENQVLSNKYPPSQYAYERMWHATKNPNGTFPRAGSTGVYLSDRTNANWNYFVLRNIKLAYDFSSLINVKGINNLNMYVNLQNFLSTAPKHRGYNPENGDVSHPWAKMVIIGVNAKF